MLALAHIAAAQNLDFVQQAHVSSSKSESAPASVDASRPKVEEVRC